MVFNRLTRPMSPHGFRRRYFKVPRILGGSLHSLLPRPQAVTGGSRVCLPIARRRASALQQRLILLILPIQVVEELIHTYRQTTLIWILVFSTLSHRSARLPRVCTGHRWWIVVRPRQPLPFRLPQQLSSQISSRSASARPKNNAAFSKKLGNERRSHRPKNATHWPKGPVCHSGVYKYGNCYLTCQSRWISIRSTDERWYPCRFQNKRQGVRSSQRQCSNTHSNSTNAHRHCSNAHSNSATAHTHSAHTQSTTTPSHCHTPYSVTPPATTHCPSRRHGPINSSTEPMYITPSLDQARSSSPHHQLPSQDDSMEPLKWPSRGFWKEDNVPFFSPTNRHNYSRSLSSLSRFLLR